jgi:REP element-mobilizing transposase RayT
MELAMPRRARMYLPGLPYHVVQRGNNREACFIKATLYCQPIGDDRFRQQIEQKYSIRLGLMERECPRK